MPRPLKAVDTSTYAGQVSAEVRRRRVKLFDRAEEAAAAAGVPAQTWYGWESGKIHLDALPIVAAALKCKPRQLLPA
jgi:hypothetical protein